MQRDAPRDGTSVDGENVGLYFGLDEALAQAGRSAGDRADAMLLHPDHDAMPAALVYRLARTLTEARRFGEAEALFVGRFFPSEEGGINVREVYLEVRVGRAQTLAAGGNCRIHNRQGQGVISLPASRCGDGPHDIR